jgi:hypothetical protein
MELITFGNYCLTNNRLTVATTTNRDLSPIDVQLSSKARGNGSVVVNTRTAPKQIQLSGAVIGSDLATYTKGKEYLELSSIRITSLLRFIQTYLEVWVPTSTTGVTVSQDAGTLTYDTNEFQLGAGALKFNLTVGASVSNYGRISKGVTSFAFNQSYYNIEFFTYIPDASLITSLTLYLQSSASNYLSTSITSNVNGDAFVNGWNLISVPFSSFASSGTPVTSAITTVYIDYNYLSTATSQTGVMLSGLIRTDERYTRSYRANSQAGVSVDGYNYNISDAGFDYSFIAFDGFGLSTHQTTLFNQTGVTTTSNSQSITLEGTDNPSPLFNLQFNTITAISKVAITNTTTNDTIQFDTTGLTAGQILTFGGEDNLSLLGSSPIPYTGTIPTFNIGLNKIRLDVTASGISTVSNATGGVEYFIPSSELADPSTYGNYRIAQTFTATATGTLTGISFKTRYALNRTPSQPRIWDFAITNTSAGNPSTTLLTSGVFTVDSTSLKTYTISGLSLAVTNGTVYALILPAGYNQTADMEMLEQIVWDSTTSNPYAGGKAVRTDNANAWGDFASSTWSDITTTDFVFSVTISPAVAWNIGWSAKYKKHYRG